MLLVSSTFRIFYFIYQLWNQVEERAADTFLPLPHHHNPPFQVSLFWPKWAFVSKVKIAFNIMRFLFAFGQAGIPGMLHSFVGQSI